MLVEPYAADPFKHLDDGHVTILDLESMREVPFHPYDHQRELGAAWVDLAHLRRTGLPRWRNVHEEKSRQMGMSWIIAWVDLWALMYHPFSGLAVHIRGREVDDGGQGSTPDSYFGRIRFMHDRLPLQYRAPLNFTYQLIRNEQVATAFLVGEKAGPDPGRGGKYARVLIDEAARIRWGESAQAALAAACPSGRLYNSTPHGEGNVFYRLRRDRPTDVRFLTHHWSKHPVYRDGLHVAAVAAVDKDGAAVKQPKQPSVEMRAAASACTACTLTRDGGGWRANQPQPRPHRYPGKLTSSWYEEAILHLTDDQVAAELDIDYTGSLAARVYSEFDEQLHVAPFRLAYDPNVGVELAIDYGTDTTAVVILQDLPDEVRVIGEMEEHRNAHPDTVVPEVLRVLADLGIPDRLLTPQWTLRMLAVGDPAGEARQQATGRPLVADYQRLGFRIQSPMRMSVQQTIVATKRLLNGVPKPVIISGPDCPLFVEHLKNNVYPTDREGNRKAGVTEPLNDEHNHVCFVAGTLVTTARGDVPVETVRAGDLALTRLGWRRVIAAGSAGSRPTFRAEFEGGHVVGTEDHPLWVRGQGWIPLGSLDHSMSLYVLGEASQQGWFVAGESERGVASVAEEPAHQSGGMVVVDVKQSLPVASGASGRRATAGEAESSLNLDHSLVFGEGDPVFSAEPVVAVLRAPISGERSSLLVASPVATTQASGRVALEALVPSSLDRRPTVLAAARDVPDELRTGTELSRRVAAPLVYDPTQVARSAAVGIDGHGSPAIDARLRFARHARIINVAPESVRATVYNLEVEGCHEYFANGALVSNCRAFAYWVTYKFPPSGVEESLSAATGRWGASPELAEAVEARRGGLSRGTRL